MERCGRGLTAGTWHTRLLGNERENQSPCRSFPLNEDVDEMSH
jgi:hypothetical protein